MSRSIRQATSCIIHAEDRSPLTGPLAQSADPARHPFHALVIQSSGPENRSLALAIRRCQDKPAIVLPVMTDLTCLAEPFGGTIEEDVLNRCHDCCKFVAADKIVRHPSDFRSPYPDKAEDFISRNSLKVLLPLSGSCACNA